MKVLKISRNSAYIWDVSHKTVQYMINFGVQYADFFLEIMGCDKDHLIQLFQNIIINVLPMLVT